MTVIEDVATSTQTTDTQTTNDSAGQKSVWAFALVHGIGTTQPLPMIKEVCDAIKGARPSLELTKDAEIHEVMEEGAPRYHHIRYGHFDGGRARVGTVHWADVTYYRQGLISTIGIILMAAFGVRFFASVAARHTKPTPMLVKLFSIPLVWLLHTMVVVLALLVFPVTFVALVYATTGLLAEYIVKFQGPSATALYQAIAIATVGLTVCLLLARVGINRVKPMKERTLGLWIFRSMAVAAVILSSAMMWDRLVDPELSTVIRDQLIRFVDEVLVHKDLRARIAQTDRIGVFFAALHILQLAFGIGLLILVCAIVFVLSLYVCASILTGRRWHTMVFAVTLVVSIWLVLLVMLWPENLATHAAMSRFSSVDPKGCITVTAVRPISEWLAKSPFDADAKVKATPDADCGGGIFAGRMLSDIYPLLWFEAVLISFLVAFLGVIAFVFVARTIWVARQSRKGLEPFAPAADAIHPLRSSWPRLIVAKSYVTLVLFFMVVAATVFILRAVPDLDLRLLGIKLPHEASIQAESVRAGVVLFVVVFAVFSTWIVDGLKLVLDVVNHFTQPPNYPVRRKIENRFDEMVERLVDAGSKPNLVIIAHSQGTVITIDALLKSGWVEGILEKVTTLTIITFGSPFTHVYQRYFPREYNSLAETGLLALSSNPRIRWVNAYRIDDYVGTYIENSIPGFPENIPLPIGGHTRYFEADVMKEVFAHPKLAEFILPSPAPTS